MMDFVRKHPFTVIASAVVVVAAIAWLAFGYFAFQTHFIDDEVSEAAPVFDASPADEAATEIPVDAPAEPPVVASGSQPDTPLFDAPPATSVPAPPVAPPAPPPATDEIVTEYAGRFESDAHTTTGSASVLGNGTEQRFLRFEAFETDNGPDLDVYLVNSSADGGSDFVSLGDLTGNIGDQNYEIPSDVDLEVYDRVVIWCVRFGVGFGFADLTSV
jgi:hypothetical protein